MIYDLSFFPHVFATPFELGFGTRTLFHDAHAGSDLLFRSLEFHSLFQAYQYMTITFSVRIVHAIASSVISGLNNGSMMSHWAIN